jgi:hypothetical protein
MTQNFLMAALTLTALAARRLGTLRPAGRPRREYALADFVVHPAILLGMRCREGDRHSLELLLESFAPRAARGAPPVVAPDRGPVLFH